MRFITARELRLNPARVWKLAREEKDLVVTTNGRPVAILTGIDEQNLEEELQTLRRARALRALDAIHRESAAKEAKHLSPEEIQSEIETVRKERML